MRKLNQETAAELFFEKFFELHPKGTVPKWFREYSSYSAGVKRNGDWEMQFTVFPLEELHDHETLERDTVGRNVLVRKNPKTGEKGYLISRSNNSAITIFQVIVKSDGTSPRVTINRDLSELDVDKLQKQ